MKLRNPFSEKTRLLFLYEYGCWNCGLSGQGLELHHREGRCSASPLNACLLCPRCHSKGKRDKDFKKRMEKKILEFLEREEYTLNNEDEDFYTEYFGK